MADSSPQGAPNDRYVVQEYLSEGGMGAIYIGRKMGAGGFSKQVVLKQLLPEFTSQKEFRDLFLREARLSATLDHANIVHTIDLVNADEDFFIVMEYVPGADLRTLLKKAKRRHKRFSPSAGIYVTRELLSALGYAHGKRGTDGKYLHLIHRDVSPSNILISRNGEVKLTDFGIAKASTHNSVLYRVKGKMGYMSPEQAKSETLDHRSDLYSLAVCLYEMVAGERLFVKAGLATSADEMYSRPVPLLAREIDGVPPEFDKVMLRALHVDPAHRYQTASAFQDALSRCAHRAGLMISAPELSSQLHDVCGQPEKWRDMDDIPERPSMEFDRPGTEVIDDTNTDLLDPDELSDVDLISVHAPRNSDHSIVNDRQRRQQRSRSSIFDLDRLRGMELTSMIDISRQHAPGGTRRKPSGSVPLVDMGDLKFESSPAPEAGVETIDVGRMPAPHGIVQGMESIQPLENRLEPEPDLGAGHVRAGWPAHPESMRQPGGRPGLAASNRAGASMSTPGSPGGGGYTAHQPRLSRRRPRRMSRGVFVLLIVLVIVGVIAAMAIGLSGPDMGDETRPDSEAPGAPAGDSSGVPEGTGPASDPPSRPGP